VKEKKTETVKSTNGKEKEDLRDNGNQGKLHDQQETAATPPKKSQKSVTVEKKKSKRKRDDEDSKTTKKSKSKSGVTVSAEEIWSIIYDAATKILSEAVCCKKVYFQEINA
jgi:hypothetical protein